VLISDGLQNGELYYNLANAQFRQGMLGFSMAHYLKAKEFMPRDGDLAHNLRFARKQTKDKIEPVSWQALKTSLLFWYDSFNAREWLWIFLFFNFVAWSLAIWWILQKNELVQWSLIGVMIFTLLSGASWVSKGWIKNSGGVVLEPEVSVFSGPGVTNTRLFLLHEGTDFRIRDEDGSWLRIRLADGKEGWLNRKSVASLADL